jgi:hypothetical protein
MFLAPEVELVGELMTKLSTLKAAGRMRLTTSLRRVKRNKTRWRGVTRMLTRYERLRPSIDDSDPEVAELLPSLTQHNTIRHHMSALADFKSVSQSLQRDNITVADAQGVFQSLIEEFPDFPFASYLGTSANIVHSPAFEDAIIRIQMGDEHQLLSEEQDAVRGLIMPNQQEGDDDNNDIDLSFAERVLKRQRKLQVRVSSYIDTRFLLPTSNHVERLSSTSKRSFSTKRRSLRTLEALVFLRQNRMLWNMALVSTVVNAPTEAGDEVNKDSEFEASDELETDSESEEEYSW